MLFRFFAVPLPVPLLPQPALPSSEALRRAALSKSWQRDLHVGSRREILRWLWWTMPRYVLPVFALVLLTLWPIYPDWPQQTWRAITSLGKPQRPNVFRPETQWGAAQVASDQAALRGQNTASPPEFPAPDATSTGLILIPDNSLHSQEP